MTSLDRLFRRHALLVDNVERVDIHGGSLRVFVTPAESGNHGRGAVESLLAEEAALDIDKVSYYKDFGAKVERLRAELVSLLARLKSQGKRIVAYGASAKGTTLLNYFGIGRETLDFVVDRSTVKQGTYTPGTRLPVCDPAKLLEAMPDYALLLTWNFTDEILAQQDDYRRRGGQFIIPIPELRVV